MGGVQSTRRNSEQLGFCCVYGMELAFFLFFFSVDCKDGYKKNYKLPEGRNVPHGTLVWKLLCNYVSVYFRYFGLN